MTAEPDAATAPRRTRLRTLTAEFMRFGAVGALALIVEVLIFATLVAGGVSPLIANPITMSLRLSVAFLLTRTVVFGARDVRPVSIELPLFLAVAVGNLIIVELTLWAALEAAGGSLGALGATLVKVAAISLTLAARFAISRRWVFRAASNG